jgi:molybdopterin-biosynthesis enzyme MoeA-like protein
MGVRPAHSHSGPTHDDITYDAIARAFDRKLEMHEETKALMMTHYSERLKTLNQAALFRMALLPSPAVILRTPGLWVPLVVVENVHILPGIPWLCERMLDANRARFRTASGAFSRLLLYTRLPESNIADALTDAQNKFAKDCAIGSYPQVLRNAPPSRNFVMVSIEGRDATQVHACAQYIMQAVPELSTEPISHSAPAS